MRYANERFNRQLEFNTKLLDHQAAHLNRQDGEHRRTSWTYACIGLTFLVAVGGLCLLGLWMKEDRFVEKFLNFVLAAFALAASFFAGWKARGVSSTSGIEDAEIQE